MKSYRVILISVTSFLALQGTVARTTHKTKNDDKYIKIENDISNGAPVLPIEGGYKDPEDIPGDLSYDELRRLYGMGNVYGSDSSSDSVIPYYYYAYNPRVIYDPKSPFYIGNDYDLTNPYPAEYIPDHYSDGSEDASEGTIISESDGTPDFLEPPEDDEEVYEQTDQPTTAEPENTEHNQDPDLEATQYEESSRYDGGEVHTNTEGYFNNYMMGLPAQLQSFPMFNPEYYQSEYAQYERIAAENDRKQIELQAQGLDANTIDNPVYFPRGGRSKRGFARSLNLRARNEDIKAKSLTGTKNKADCGGGYGNGGRRAPNPADVGNGAADAVGQAAGAAGQAAAAAGNAADAASNAVENLRLANNGRRNNRRNGNNNRNNNNGRRVE